MKNIETEGKILLREIDNSSFSLEDLEVFRDVKIVRKGKKDYYNLACSFDIETTNVPYEKDSDGEFTIIADYYNDTLKEYIHTPFSFMYHWQFAFKKEDRELYVYGRRWEEFLDFVQLLIVGFNLNESRLLVIYVHNLAFEFQFIQYFFEWSKIFARSSRKVMKATSMDGIEFRCSYFLSNMNLAKFCENTPNVIHGKLEGNLDYRKYRDYDTPLTKEEYLYNMNDVLGLVECIDEYLKEDTIVTIPLTSTGFVRREVRDITKQNRNYRKYIQKGFPSRDAYLLLHEAFRGGNTHANRIFANRVVSNVYSYDIKSSYPAWMMYEEFPMGGEKEVSITNNEEMYYYMNNFCMVLQIELFDVELKPDIPFPYIDEAHCRKHAKIKADNGRVMDCAYLLYTCTNIDLDIIFSQYNISSYKVIRAYIWKKGKLPEEIRQGVINYFQRKTQLDGVEEKVYEYLKSKNKLNSIFGMMVTALVMDDVYYDNGNWLVDKPDIDAALARVKKSYNTFLLYQWGVFITAHARNHLQKMIDKVGMDGVYIDTDSLKFIGKENCRYFEEENENVLNMMADSDMETYAFNPDGVKEILGIWEYEGCYAQFKTLGAKKYCNTNLKKKSKDDPEYIVTVSGMNKKKGSRKIKDIDSDFEIGQTFEDIGRTTAFYNDAHPKYVKIKGDKEILLTPNVAILDTTYTLGITSSYAELIIKNLSVRDKSNVKWKKKVERD